MISTLKAFLMNKQADAEGYIHLDKTIDRDIIASFPQPLLWLWHDDSTLIREERQKGIYRYLIYGHKVII